MKCAHRIEKNICIVSMNGNLALEETEEAQKYTTPLLNDSAIQGFIFNLEQVKFLDSHGIGWIALLDKDLKSLQKTLVFCHLNTRSNELFAMMGLNKILNIYDTEEAAISSHTES